jgi:hypothetical protein
MDREYFQVVTAITVSDYFNMVVANSRQSLPNVLNSQTEEEKFHYHYRQLQVIANLSDWREFLTKDF